MSSSTPSLNDTLGAILIGTFVSLILFGLALHQAYEYYCAYPYDKTWLKVYVAIVIAFEATCTALTIHICYYYAVSNYSNIVALDNIVWSSSTLAIVGSIMVVYTQYFFMHRAWLIGKQYRPLVIIASAFLATEIGVCMAMPAYQFQLKTWSAYSKYTWLISVHNASSGVADLLITGVLIRTLRSSRTGIKQTNNLINTLILYSVSTGLITGLYNIASLILSLVLPKDQIYWGVVFVGIKLYSNSVLAALNSRQYISARNQPGVTETSPFGFSVRPDSDIEVELDGMKKKPQPAIRVDKTRTTRTRTSSDSNVVIQLSPGGPDVVPVYGSAKLAQSEQLR